MTEAINAACRVNLKDSSFKVATTTRKVNRDFRAHAGDFMSLLRDTGTTLPDFEAEYTEAQTALWEIVGSRKDLRDAKAERDANPDDVSAFEAWNRKDAALAVYNRNAKYRSHTGRALCRIRGLDISNPAEGFTDATAEDWATLQSHAAEFPNMFGMENWGRYGGEPSEPNRKPSEGPRNDGGAEDTETDAETVELPESAAEIVESCRVLYGDGCANSVAGILAYWEEKTNRDAEDADTETE